MKTVLAFSLAFLSAWPAGAQSKPDSQPDWPRTWEQAVARLVTDLSDADKTVVRALPKDAMSAFHHGWGTGIRNEFGLWAGNRQLLTSCALKAHPELKTELQAGPGSKLRYHPDDASGVIIDAVWDTLRKSVPATRPDAEHVHILLQHDRKGEHASVASIGGRGVAGADEIAKLLAGRGPRAAVPIRIAGREFGPARAIPLISELAELGFRDILYIEAEATATQPAATRPDS